MDKDAPEEIHGVSMSIFSVARHYGGCTAFGTEYVYDPFHDRLIRRDIVKARKKAAQDRVRAYAKSNAEKQGQLLE